MCVLTLVSPAFASAAGSISRFDSNSPSAMATGNLEALFAGGISPSPSPLLLELAVDIELFGGGEFALRSSDAASMLRAAVASLTNVEGATASVYAVRASLITADVSYITSGASIATLKEVADGITPAISTAVEPDDRVLNERVNTGPSRMWCAPLTLPVSGPVPIPLTSVGLIITLPASHFASFGATTPAQILQAAASAQASMAAALRNAAVVNTALADFKSAWGRCTGLPPAAMQAAVAPLPDSLIIVSSGGELPVAVAAEASPSASSSPHPTHSEARPSESLVVIITQPASAPSFRVTAGSSFPVRWDFPQGDCSEADTVTILISSLSRNVPLSQADIKLSPSLTVSVLCNCTHLALDVFESQCRRHGVVTCSASSSLHRPV